MPDLPSTALHQPSPPSEAPQSTVADSSSPLAPGTGSHGRFTVLAPLAQGGLGQVSLARDEQLGRQVALKEIRPDRLSAASRRRFLTEATITGQLEHPGIVPIYALETDAAGLPCYAMRYIHGRTLTSAIAVYHAHPSPVAFRDLLHRFVSVCQTMAYAHSKGVIHRDLKPDNVMVGDYGETLVVDWGLARRAGGVSPPSQDAASDSELSREAEAPCSPTETEAGTVLGTPAYMPPEQADGQSDLGPAADIYALGAILYRLLTGQPPYRGNSTPDVLQQVRAGPPPAPQRVAPGVPRALAAVCLKAMARAPADRYPSAGDLAQDVNRWLADEPVAADREPLLSRLARWGRRNRTAVGSGMAALLVAVIGLSVGLVLLGQEQARTAAQRDQKEEARLEAEKNEQKAVAASRRAEEKEKEAHAARRRTRRALDDVSTQAFNTLLKQQAHLLPEHREMLRNTLAYYTEFAEAPGTDEAARAEVATAHARMAEIRLALGELAEAHRAIARARQLYRRLVADVPSSARYRADLASAWNTTAILYHKQARMKESEKAFLQVVRIERELPAGANLTEHDESVFYLARTNLGSLYVETGRTSEAETTYRAALAHSTRRLARARSPSRQLRSDHAFVLGALAGLLDHDRPREAEPLLKQAGDLLRGLLQEFPSHPEYIEKLSDVNLKLASLRARSSQPGEAERTYRAVVAERRKLVERFPAVPRHRQDLALALHNLGRFYQEAGRLREAEQPYRESLTVRDRLVADCPAVPDYRFDLAMTCNNLANLLYEEGQFGEAVKLSRRGLDLNRKLAEAHPDVPKYREMEAGSTLNLAAQLFFRVGKSSDALPLFRRGVRLARALLKENPSDPERRRLLAMGQLNFSSLLYLAGEDEESNTLANEARAAFRKLVQQFPANPDYRMDLVKSLSNRLLALDRASPAEATRTYGEIIEQVRKLLADHPRSPHYRGWLAHVNTIRAGQLIPRGPLPEVEKMLREAIEVREQLAADFPRIPDHRAQAGYAHSLLAELYDRARQPDKAVRARKACITLYTALVADYPTAGRYRLFLAEAHAELGMHQLRNDLNAEAEKSFRAALPLMRRVLDDGQAPPEYATRLGGSHVNLGITLRYQGKHADALAEVDRGLAVLQAFAQKKPDDRTAAVYLRNAHAERARNLDALGRSRDALANWDQAVKRTPVRERATYRLERAASLARAGQPARATAEVEELTRDAGTAPAALLRGAVVLAVAAGTAGDPTARDRAAAAALALLTRGRQRGLLKGPEAAKMLRKLPELKPLHDRADFKKLLAELAKEAEETPPGPIK